MRIAGFITSILIGFIAVGIIGAYMDQMIPIMQSISNVGAHEIAVWRLLPLGLLLAILIASLLGLIRRDRRRG